MAENSIVYTKNVPLALKAYAEKHHFPVDRLDFTLIGIQSYFKSCHHEAFVKFHDDYKREYASSEKIIKDNVRFIQMNKIRIHPKKKEDPTSAKNISLLYRLELGEFSTYPILVLSPESRLPLAELTEQEMLKLLYTELNKIKAQNRILINLFSSCMVKDLKDFITRLYRDGFTQEESILLFEGIDPEISEPSKVINPVSYTHLTLPTKVSG